VCGVAVRPDRATLSINGLHPNRVVFKDLCNPCAAAVDDFMAKAFTAIQELRVAGYTEPLEIMAGTVALKSGPKPVASAAVSSTVPADDALTTPDEDVLSIQQAAGLQA
jgi:hypothetical protein